MPFGTTPIPKMVVSFENLPKITQLITQGEKELEKKIHALNLRMIRTFAESAEEKYRSSLLGTRRGESGARAGENPEKDRMTGRFLPFGVRGGAVTFKGVIINESQTKRFGWGYPNVTHADAVSHGIWRVLEWGLSGTERSRANSEFASTGVHMVPGTPRNRWGGPDYSQPFAPRTGAWYRGKGVPGKYFLTDTAREFTAEDMAKRYENVYEKWRKEAGLS